MLNILNKWIYLSYDRETIKKYSSRINKDNLKILEFSIYSSMIGSFIAITFFRIINPALSFIAPICIILLFSILYLSFAFHLRQQTYKNSNIYINLLIIFSSLTFFILLLFLTSLLSVDSMNFGFVWTILVMQILYIWSPTNNLKITGILLILYLIFVGSTNDSLQFFYALMNSLIVLFAGSMMSWNRAKLKIDFLLTEDLLHKQMKSLTYANTIDPLTGLYNRKTIFDLLYNIGETCYSESIPIACLVIDVDDFKAYNDTYGHPEGDELLRKLGSIFQEFSNKHNIHFGRMGGEEFIATWKVENEYDTISLANQIRRAVYDLKIPHHHSTNDDVVTISQGLTIIHMDDESDVHHAYSIADQALYKAKNNGKNRLEIA